MTGWLAALLPETRERVFVVMRRLRATSYDEEAASRALSPPAGTIAVGGAHMDPLWRGHALGLLLTHIGHGVAPVEAGDMTKPEVAGWILKWNASCEFQVHRWPQGIDGVIDDAVRALLAAVEGNAHDGG